LSLNLLSPCKRSLTHVPQSPKAKRAPEGVRKMLAAFYAA
jgi:hypothetical protein